MNFDKLNYDSDIIYNNRLDAAMEATSIAHQMKEEYTLRDKYFPYVESFLPKTEHVLFKHIAKYDDKNSSIVNSPYPTKTLIFNELVLLNELI